MKLEKLFNKVRNKKNVIGYSKVLQYRIRNNKVDKREEVFRIYVTKKIPIERLEAEDIIPSVLSKVPTDIVETGEITALVPTGTFTVDRTSRIRPVPLAVSVGNATITAGSLGMLYEDSENNIYAGSNAHVLCENPIKNSEEQSEYRIIQPGSYHGGITQEDVVGLYHWHDRIIPITENLCPIANFVAKSLNFISKLLGRKTVFKLEANTVNNQDFAVYKPAVEHVLEVPDASLKNKSFIGHLFAGSDSVGVICKVKYAVRKGFYPLTPYTEVNNEDEVEGHSFWGDYSTIVTDDSAMIRVAGYDNSIALFDDVILVKNGSVIKGGWSGSGWFKK